MLQFISRRLLLFVPVMLGILLVVFIIVRLIPGDPCFVMMGERATPEQCELFSQRFGLNDNIAVQFGRYLGNLVQGDLGESIRDRQPITETISERLPMTVELALLAMTYSSILGVILGVVSALKRNSIIDVATMLLANIGVSMPIFWLGLMLAYFFALVMQDTPFYIPPNSRLSAGVSIPNLREFYEIGEISGISAFLIDFGSHSALISGLLTGDFELIKDSLWHLILPAFALGTIPLAVVARMTRSSLLDVLGQDYVRTARAKGLDFRTVVTRHALRNALIPIVTIIGIETGQLLGGAVLTETIFSLPGVGSRMVDAILVRDYPVVQGFTLVIAVIFVVSNLIVDFSYAFLDPRIRLE
jgi:peptide/nickel transport system permease protein